MASNSGASMMMALVSQQQQAAAAAQAQQAAQQAQERAAQAAREAEAKAMAEAKESIGRISGLTGVTAPQAIDLYKQYFKEVIPGATAKYEKQIAEYNPDLSSQYTKLAGQLMDQRKMTALNDPTYMQYATGKVPGQFLNVDWAGPEFQRLMTYNV